MTKGTRALVIVLACIFVAVMLFSYFYVARQTAHCCHDKNCPVCAVLKACESILRELLPWVVMAVVLIAAGFFAEKTLRYAVPAAEYGTPVSLKIKLLV